MLLLALFAGSGLVMLVAVIGFLTLGGGDGADDAGMQALREIGCTTTVKAATSRRHVQEGTNVEYSTDPPSSGAHYQSPALWGEYDEEIDQRALVHNLEHGGIVIQYGRQVPRATVEEILELYRDSPNGMLVAPLPRLERRISVAAWTAEQTGDADVLGEGRLGVCTRFDRGAFETFRDAYRAKGPEGATLDVLLPGT